MVDRLTKEQFKKQWGDKADVDWDDTAWTAVSEPWRTENEVMVAEWWKREEVDREILLFQDSRDGSMLVYDKDQIQEDEDFQAAQLFCIKADQNFLDLRVCLARNCLDPFQFVFGWDIFKPELLLQCRNAGA